MSRDERRRRVAFAIGVISVISVITVVAALMRAHHVRAIGPYDVLRAFVLGQSAVIISLYAAAAVREAHNAWRSEKNVEWQMWQGRVAMILAILVLLYDEVMRVWNRLGEPGLNPRTPTLQVALWLLLIAYLWVVRRYRSAQGAADAVLRGRRW